MPVLASGTTLGTNTGAVGSNPESVRDLSSQPSIVDVPILALGLLMCILLVVSGRYWKGNWKLPAPVMGVSSVAFFVLKSDVAVKPAVSWM
jgi:hypothetical protein